MTSPPSAHGILNLRTLSFFSSFLGKMGETGGNYRTLHTKSTQLSKATSFSTRSDCSPCRVNAVIFTHEFKQKQQRYCVNCPSKHIKLYKHGVYLPIAKNKQCSIKVWAKCHFCLPSSLHMHDCYRVNSSSPPRFGALAGANFLIRIAQKLQSMWIAVYMAMETGPHPYHTQC